MKRTRRVVDGVERELHRDESRPVERYDHTLHKLEAIRRYWLTWSSIIVAAGKAGKIQPTDQMWLVDVCAGAGLHLSDESPYGAIPGSAISACYAALSTQQVNPGVVVHVRLVEKHPEYWQGLCKRIERFQTPPAISDRVDVRADKGDFARYVPEILRETRRSGKRHFSLWFIDPDGIKEMPHTALDPLADAGFGVETIINLDVGGLFRVKAVVESSSAPELMKAADTALLDATFGDDSWRSALSSPSKTNLLEAVASAYADTLPKFKRKVHRLKSSASQFRYLIHLAHSDRAIEKFEADFKTAMNLGTLGTRSLSQSDCDKLATKLFRRFRGQRVSLEDLYASQVEDVLPQQLVTVLHAAQRFGYGKFDADTREMTWFEEPPAPLTLGFET